MTKSWDYLIVTAANDRQAEAYRFQLQQRQQAAELPQVRTCLVIPDIEGRRIGSGGSTLHCLHQILQREQTKGCTSFEDAESILAALRILIVHAGGDSRRLPAYSHCGKMFVPVPAQNSASTAVSLFDRLVPAFLSLPEAHPGQIVVASGDALILFDSSAVDFNRRGITALGSLAPPRESAQHGVFSVDQNGAVQRFLQKPTPDAQIAAGAINEAGDSVLDVGVMSFESTAAAQLMRTFFEVAFRNGAPTLAWKPASHAALLSHGIDLYREICCALGTSSTLDQYLDCVRTARPTLHPSLLAEWFEGLQKIPFHVDILPGSKFFHFGTTRQLITTGIALRSEDSVAHASTSLVMNSDIHAEIAADRAWIEGCSVRNALTLSGDNVLVGIDIVEPLRLPKGACLDLSMGDSRDRHTVWFFRLYDVDDTFKHTVYEGGCFCARPLGKWLAAVGASPGDVWSRDLPEGERTLWNARVFPAVEQQQQFHDWLWLWDPDAATVAQRIAFLKADRYSSSDIALRVDQAEFRRRRLRLCSAAARRTLAAK